MEVINKYINGKIYKISHIEETNNDFMYIGSTYGSLNQRLSRHKSKYRSRYQNNSIFILFDLYGPNNCKIELLEEYPCNNRYELHTREGQYIRENILKCVNKKIPRIHI